LVFAIDSRAQERRKRKGSAKGGLKKKKGEKEKPSTNPTHARKRRTMGEQGNTRTVQQGKKINSPRQFIHT